MIKLVILALAIYGIFWLADTPEGVTFRKETSAAFKQNGLKGMVDSVWCGEKGCDSQPGKQEPPVERGRPRG